MCSSLTSEKTHHWNDYASLCGGVCLSDKQLRLLQLTLSGMLKDVVSVCDKYQIPYYLVGGTALGAIRHGGFIPWDDDIDLAMYRQDYERFLACAESELAEKYYFQVPEYTDGYPSMIPRIRARGTIVQSREDLWTDLSQCGAWVDVFVIENTFDNRILRFIHGLACLFSGGLLACRKTFDARKQLRKFTVPGSEYSKKILLRSIIGGAAAWIPMNLLRKFANGCFSICKNKQSRIVTIPSGHWRFFGDMYLREDFGRTQLVDFSGIPCRVSVSVEKYLTHCYGDWRKIPPQSDREVHFFCAFSINDNFRKNGTAVRPAEGNI